MKLQDPNTIIEKEIKTEVLNGVAYWVVKVPYEKDVWYFYLDKESFEMKSTRLKSSLKTQGNDYFNRQRFHVAFEKQILNT
jgi:hypothetical protein